MEVKLFYYSNKDSLKNISSTYMNKAVILSELGLHVESIETLKKALDHLENFRNLTEKEMEE